MTKPLSEESLREKIGKLYVDAHTAWPECRAKDWPDVFTEKVMQIILQERQAWGEQRISDAYDFLLFGDGQVFDMQSMRINRDRDKLGQLRVTITIPKEYEPELREQMRQRNTSGGRSNGYGL